MQPTIPTPSPNQPIAPPPQVPMSSPTPNPDYQEQSYWWPPQNVTDPGRTLALVGMFASILIGPIALIPLFISRQKSKAVGIKNKFVQLFIVLDIITLVLMGFALVLLVIGLLNGAGMDDSIYGEPVYR